MNSTQYLLDNVVYVPKLSLKYYQVTGFPEHPYHIKQQQENRGALWNRSNPAIDQISEGYIRDSCLYVEIIDNEPRNQFPNPAEGEQMINRFLI